MRAITVNESLSLYEAAAKKLNMAEINRKARELKGKYDIFDNLTFYWIIEKLDKTPGIMSNGKIDPEKYFKKLQTNVGLKASYERFEEILYEAIMILGIIDHFKIAKDKKSALKFQEKFVYGSEEPIEYYIDNEIPSMHFSEPTDYVVRSKDGNTEPAFYRFDKRLNQKDRNLLRAAYALTYGDEDLTPWSNYLNATPIMKKNLDRGNKDMRQSNRM